MNTKYTFKVNSLRTLTSPYKKAGEKDTESIYYLLVDMRDLPEGMPLDVNPREPKMTTNVARRIANAVIEPETDFYINNRGIVIAAKKAVFDSAKSEFTIDLGDQENDNDKYSYGILDGGHTYTAIMNNRDKIPADLTKYVRVEVITNVQNITRLSDARNTSAQVSDIALFKITIISLFTFLNLSGLCLHLMLISILTIILLRSRAIPERLRYLSVIKKHLIRPFTDHLLYSCRNLLICMIPLKENFLQNIMNIKIS